jgi:transcription elongation factor Elf1
VNKEEFNIICPYCNEPHSASLILDIEEDYGGCVTCGPASADVEIEIKCKGCDKVLYKKEGKSYDF